MTEEEQPYEYVMTTASRDIYGRPSEKEFVVVYDLRTKEVGIRWTCGETVGGWTVEQFADLLKQIAKVPYDKPLVLQVEPPNYGELYGVQLHEDGTVMYGDSAGYIDGRGPSLPELKKALSGIKKYIKKQEAAEAKAKMTV